MSAPTEASNQTLPTLWKHRSIYPSAEHEAGGFDDLLTGLIGTKFEVPWKTEDVGAWRCSSYSGWDEIPSERRITDLPAAFGTISDPTGRDTASTVWLAATVQFTKDQSEPDTAPVTMSIHPCYIFEADKNTVEAEAIFEEHEAIAEIAEWQQKGEHSFTKAVKESCLSLCDIDAAPTLSKVESPSREAGSIVSADATIFVGQGRIPRAAAPTPSDDEPISEITTLTLDGADSAPTEKESTPGADDASLAPE